MKNQMIYSKSGLYLTENFEGLRLSAYQDVVGVWTIGYGHTDGVFEGMSITKLQAEQFLLSDIQISVECINRLVSVELSQSEFDALVDFVFNVGAGNFSKSTLLLDINSGELDAASQQFLIWNKAGGKTVSGLTDRRTAESKLFASNDHLININKT